jgi:hypothetical protein
MVEELCVVLQLEVHFRFREDGGGFSFGYGVRYRGSERVSN